MRDFDCKHYAKVHFNEQRISSDWTSLIVLIYPTHFQYDKDQQQWMQKECLPKLSIIKCNNIITLTLTNKLFKSQNR